VLRAENRKCKLFREGELIDDNVVCHVNLGEKSEFSLFVAGGGEFETSKPLLVNLYDLLGKTRFKLAFDKPLGTNEFGRDILGHEIVILPIFLTDVDLKSKTRAFFKVNTYRE
jgi:hypothetical protein